MFALPEDERRRLRAIDETERPAPLGPLYVEANRYEDAASALIDRIREFTPRTLAGVIVQLELAVEREDIDTAASALRSLHEIAKREAFR